MTVTAEYKRQGAKILDVDCKGHKIVTCGRNERVKGRHRTVNVNVSYTIGFGFSGRKTEKLLAFTFVVLNFHSPYRI